jgi:hypothetical protein
MAMTTASKFARSSSKDVAPSPTVTLGKNSTPLSRITAESPIQHRLFHLELGYAVAQESADGVAALKDAHGVPDAA